MRLNLGCGRKPIDGWVNIDIAGEPDVRCDLRAVPLEDGCADEAMAIHVIEHFHRRDVPGLLLEWKRLLRPGGKIAIECPDLMRCAKNILRGASDPEGMWGIYGDPSEEDRHMQHQWGWTPATLGAELKAAGFIKVRSEVPRFHRGVGLMRDMRLEARKP